MLVHRSLLLHLSNLVACHREIGHPSHREPFRRTGLIHLLGWRLSRVGTWWTITSQDEEDYEDDGNHGIMISTITSRTGSYQSTPLVVRGEPGGNLPDDLWSWEMSFTKGPSRGTRPSLLNRKKERTLLNKLIQVRAEDTSTAKCLPRKSWGKASLLKVRVSRDVRNVHSFDGIFFQNAASCRMAGPSSIPKVFETPNEKSVPSKAWLLRSGAA